MTDTAGRRLTVTPVLALSVTACGIAGEVQAEETLDDPNGTATAVDVAAERRRAVAEHCFCRPVCRDPAHIEGAVATTAALVPTLPRLAGVARPPR